MSNAPVYFAWVTRQDSQTLYLDAVELPADSLFTNYHRQLEQVILEYPEQYFGWTHRRFLSTSRTLYQQF
jgi:lauroyl/myristoyl acyltransferase